MNAKLICTGCDEAKPIEEFPKQGDYRLKRCRTCHRARKRRYVEGERYRPRLAGEIPMGPFLEWLNVFVVRWPSFTEACHEIETAERVVWRWLNRPGPWIPETRVDQVFCAAGEPYLLAELYPELYAEEEMAA
jgi:hypothetical protein